MLNGHSNVNQHVLAEKWISIEKFGIYIAFERCSRVYCEQRIYSSIQLTILEKVKVVIALPTNAKMYLARENGLRMNSRCEKRVIN